jgi:hypothetical protein
MNECDDFVRLFAAALQGVLSNATSFTSKADLVRVAAQHAQDALQAVNIRFPKNRHTPIEQEQREFARRIERDENGRQ